MIRTYVLIGGIFLPFNLSLYKPTTMELWISQIYMDNGIHQPNDMDLKLIASLFNCEVAYSNGSPKVLFDEEIGGIIFLSSGSSLEQQRIDFFHELSHPALHIGNQTTMPKSFVNLQESQAASFQMYSAIPFFMLKELSLSHYFQNYIPLLCEAFQLPASFVRYRLEQIQRRIIREQRDQLIKARLNAFKPQQEYSKETLSLIEKLQSQLTKKGEKGYASL